MTTPSHVRMLALLAIGLAVTVCSLPVAKADGEKEEADERRHISGYVHKIQLKDADGKPIEPGSTAPYSPRQTCSGPECHSYEKVASGMHFDMGKKLMSDDWGKAKGRPWHLSPGMVGGYLASFRRQYAKKKNASAAEIDMTAYGFVKSCGACHPGGGAMETDRDGQRYDQRMAKEEGLAESLDGDYHKARWDKSGVVEVDCLMCHANFPYNNKERRAQLSSENYAFAATAAAGFAVVRGKVSEAAAVTVAYSPRLFDSQGYVTLDIGMPKDASCLQCHHTPKLKDGEGWQHDHWRDIHTAQGMACIDCHASEGDHNFELGRALHYSAAKSEREPMGCKRCHDEGQLGAPKPVHAGFPRFHFDKIACTTCHSGPALTVRGTAPVLTDMAASTPAMAGAPLPFPDPQAPWQILYAPVDGQIRVHNCQASAWWGNRAEDDTVFPYFLSEIAPALEAAAGDIGDNNNDGIDEVNTKAEIAAVDAQLRKLLAGGRFGEVRPAFVNGRTVYRFDEGSLNAREDGPQSLPQRVTLGHAVRGAQQALGAKGCTDCHSRESYIFGGDRIAIGLSNTDKVKTRSMRRLMNMRNSRITLGAVREAYLKPYGLLLIPLTLFLCLLHYVVFGAKRAPDDDPDDIVRRFTVLERVVHLVQLFTFIALAVSGCAFIASAHMRGAVPTVWTSGCAVWLHTAIGCVFLVSSLALIARWLPNAIFSEHDTQWFRVMGGYLWMKGEAPAGKFNAGQKALFWLVAVACIVLGATGVIMALRPEGLADWMGHAATFHTLLAIVLIPAIIAHVYLNSIATPGALRAIFLGSVTRAWAKKHHPNWIDEQDENSPS